MNGGLPKPVLALTVLLLFASLPSHAADYPTRPINMVVALPPGGVADVLARAIGQRLTAEWGQPVIVENKAAAATQLGATFVSRAAPDGYTLLLTPEFTVTVNPFLYKEQVETVKNLTPVSGLATVPLALVVNSALPVDDVTGLIAWAKANPGKLNFGVPGLGSISHLSTEMFKTQAGIKSSAVPYRGAAPALTDLIGGRVDAMFVAIGLVSEPARAGQLRMLGIAASKRLPQFPDLPAIAETLPGFETMIWFGLFAPKGTAPDIVTKLNAAVQRIIAEPEFDKSFMAVNSYQRIAGDANSLSAIIERDSARWGKIIRDGGITAEP